ncbi:DUF3793 family protein [Clostridium sp. WILCCON 0269]|uniref:DUF3793 family protein n=1 Tax=Candidatus Clostridium eludens TaxID=3381663 RepID=A0ABW8SLE7_9CLOT
MKNLNEEFIESIYGADEKEYMMNLITYAISPTIAGYKPSSIINISNKYKNMYSLWCKYGNEYLENISLKVFEIYKKENIIILLFYNESMLSEVLCYKDNAEFLNKFGYSSSMSLINKLNLLKDRYEYNSCPHEIGIFLGIPVRDVEDFINCGEKKCICCGYWKVYNDKENALEIFKNYDKSKYNFLRLLEKNIGLVKVVEMLSS